MNWLVWLDPPVVCGDGQNLGQHVQHSLSIYQRPPTIEKVCIKAGWLSGRGRLVILMGCNGWAPIREPQTTPKEGGGP